MTDNAHDAWLWLEDVTGAPALDWVHARNAETVRAHASGAGFGELCDRLREALDSEEKLPYVRRRGPYLYNFWQDAGHPRGLWRRTTPERYGTDDPGWEVLLDLDALAREEDDNWVWQGAALLRPGFRRALVHLSRGGADAVTVREFDVDERRFVADGFELPEAKSDVGWIDGDRIYVGTDFGDGSLTDSGYPRVVKEWHRGTALSEAVTVFEGSTQDVYVTAHHDPTPGFERDFVRRALDFYRSELWLRTAQGELVRIDVPEDAEASAHREWLIVRTRSPWRTGGREHPAGALLAARFDAFLAGDRDLEVLFEPDGRTSLEGWAPTRHHLLLTVMSDVRTRLHLLTPGAGPDGGWRCETLPEPAAMATVSVLDTDPEQDDEYLTVTGGFLTPPTLSRADAAAGAADAGEQLKAEPEFFDTDGLGVEQFFAVSEDGTEVPYFVVRPRDGRPGPTLLSGYGGFEVARTPSYSAMIGRGWLERGGSYVLANIRGGGEYGPEWHTQAVKAGRHKVYEDFAAVARDLVARGVATPRTLAIQGGSNGGLLMGVMLTRHPELFAAVAAQVPLLDMRRYHRLLAGASWTAEYGDPDDPGEWAFIGPYSPYHQVRADGGYPPVLFATSTRDDRVHPGHARKMAALMLDQGHEVHYYENTEGGHGGAANNEQTAFKWALVLDFLWGHATPEA